MASDVVISVAGAMPGDGRQRAEEQQSLVLSQLSFEWERFGPGTIEWVGLSHGKKKKRLVRLGPRTKNQAH